jgi:pimeloyl-ACP methyl ester carboxylesterase
MATSEKRGPAILLPGSVLPKDLAYGGLLEALGSEAAVRAKDLELYAEDDPPAGYGFDVEIDGILRAASDSGWERFHLAGYSAGGAIALAFTARHPERVRSLALLEPAWMGNAGMTDDERGVWSQFGELQGLPVEQFLPRFVGLALEPGAEAPPPPPGPPPWMARRPAGIQALLDAFEREELDLDALSGYPGPVYYALGTLSNQRYYGRMAERAAGLFADFTLERFAGRHHFDPPHRAEPERLARRLLALWTRRAEAPAL